MIDDLITHHTQKLYVSNLVFQINSDIVSVEMHVKYV